MPKNLLTVVQSTVKKVIIFRVPSRDVTNQTLPGQELLNCSRPGRVWLLTGDGKSDNLFLQCRRLAAHTVKRFFFIFFSSHWLLTRNPNASLKRTSSLRCIKKQQFLHIKLIKFSLFLSRKVNFLFIRLPAIIKYSAL
jgi:hypothetical protein